MSEKKEETEHSLQNAMNKLAEIVKIVAEDNREIYLKPPSQVDEALLKILSHSFSSLSVLFQEFIDQWYNSRAKGPDAIQTSDDLEDRLDVKLFRTKKLDFEQLKKIMIRMHRIDDALAGLDRVSFLLKYYEDACKEKNLTKYVWLSEIYRVHSVDILRESMRTEARRLGNQIERCNLYNSSVIETKSLTINASALRIAYIALAISGLSFLLTTLSVLKLI